MPIKETYLHILRLNEAACCVIIAILAAAYIYSDHANSNEKLRFCYMEAAAIACVSLVSSIAALHPRLDALGRAIIDLVLLTLFTVLSSGLLECIPLATCGDNSGAAEGENTGRFSITLPCNELKAIAALCLPVMITSIILLVLTIRDSREKIAMFWAKSRGPFEWRRDAPFLRF
ncbi:hypothetical protein PVAG01_03340 [Phlyctema vagabunda]|uniref:MARVEL domain-containing protein n=1 Tax=Phlyctema vagabunda TaxID=108571 RepID=A0ABR4PL54_9HELO